MTTVNIPMSDRAVQALVRRARNAYPLEACGFIMNSADPDTEHFVFETPNTAEDPRHWWRIGEDWQRLAMVDEGNVFGVWHTHPAGPDGPSETDLKYAMPGMRMFVATRNGVFEYSATN